MKTFTYTLKLTADVKDLTNKQRERLCKIIEHNLSGLIECDTDVGGKLVNFTEVLAFYPHSNKSTNK